MERIASGQSAPPTADQAYHDHHGEPELPRDVRRYDRVIGFAPRWKH
jgi:hypothetical protein